MMVSLEPVEQVTEHLSQAATLSLHGGILTGLDGAEEYVITDQIWTAFFGKSINKLVYK